MVTCELCGNHYDKTFDVTMRGETHTFGVPRPVVKTRPCSVHSDPALLAVCVRHDAHEGPPHTDLGLLAV